MGSLADELPMNVRYQSMLRGAALLLVGIFVAGCAVPEESRDMGDNNDGLFQGDQPEDSTGFAGNNTAGDAIVGPTLPPTGPESG